MEGSVRVEAIGPAPSGGGRYLVARDCAFAATLLLLRWIAQNFRP